MASKPAFVLVPGSWHSPSAYALVIEALQKEGYSVRSPERPSNSGDPPFIKNFDPDVDAVRGEIDEFLKEGKDVVLVMHSSGGIVGAEAMKYFLDNDEAKSSKTPRVIRLVYMCGFALPKGVSLVDALDGKLLWWNKVEGEAVYWLEAKKVFYGDVPNEEADRQVANLKAQAFSTWSDRMSIEPYRFVPSTYIVCEKDVCLLPELQEKMIAGAKAQVPTAFDVIERLPASHSPFLSMPQETVRLLVKAAQNP